MTETNYEIKVNNQRIFEFYKNKNINFEQMNLLFIDILEKLQLDMDTTLNNTVAIKLLEKCSQIDKKIDVIESNVHKYQQDIISNFAIKMTEYKKDYFNDMKLLLSSNNNDGLLPLIKETNNSLLDKTNLLLNDLLPKNQQNVSKELFSQLTQFQTSITTETTKLLSSSLDKTTIDSFFNTMNRSFTQSQQVLTNIISSSETRIENRINETERKMNEIKEIANVNQTSQQLLQTNITEVLKKFENGSTKGNMSEHILYNILLSLFPCATIDHVGNELKETGDIVLIRNNKPKLLIENKDHESKNVTKQEVEKFIRDCEIQNCSGIMYAQHRGICNKEHFEIQIHNNNVLLYVHEVNFDKTIIKTAIELVEQFKMKLDERILNETNSGHNIEQDVLEEIHKEVVLYISQKNAMLKMLKDFNEKMNSSINELKLPNLEKYLSNKFANSSIQNENICKYCEMHIPKSVKQHLRHCPAKKAYDLEHNLEHNNNNSDDENDIKPEINTSEIIQVNTEVVVAPKKNKKNKNQ